MYKIIGLWFSFAVLLVANENFIVLSQSDTLYTTDQEQVKYQHILEIDSDLSHLMAMTASKNDIVNVSNYYMLKVGPFRRNDILAIANT
jgi:hypothetical protein